MTHKEKILEFVATTGLNKTKFCKKCGLSNGYLDSKGSITSDKLALILENFSNLSVNWLLFDKGNMILSDNNIVNEPQLAYKLSKPSKKVIPLIPIEAVAGLGKGDIQINDKDIIDGYEIPDFERKGVEYIIRVSGSSMYPKYSNGDLLGCKRITDTTFFQWGKPYVLDTDQGVMVKRLFSVKGNDDALECHSDNKENYPPFIINKSSIYKISIVIGVLRME